ncbi:MAG: hypothetical protein GVY35_12515 [Bacteroidetes bacterium]|nr:hypothetical protein [Bacteroidota bacterium]
MKDVLHDLFATLHPRGQGERDPDAVRHAQRTAFRIIGALAALGIAASALYYPATGQRAVDPMGLRLTVAALPAVLVLLSYASAFVRRHMAVLTYALFYALMGWSILLAALSGFAPNYAVWLLFTFIALSIGHSIGLSRPEPLITFFIASLVGTAAAFVLATQSAVDPTLFMSCFVLLALLYYAALGAPSSHLRRESLGR